MSIVNLRTINKLKRTARPNSFHRVMDTFKKQLLGLESVIKQEEVYLAACKMERDALEAEMRNSEHEIENSELTIKTLRDLFPALK